MMLRKSDERALSFDRRQQKTKKNQVMRGIPPVAVLVFCMIQSALDEEQILGVDLKHVYI